MSTKPSDFDSALHLLPAPVTIIGARRGDELGGLTAAWVTRVSLAPPLLLVAIGHDRRTWELLQEAGEFTVSVLREDQIGAARLFGLKSRRDIDKWAQTEHVLLGDGVPAVADCAAHYLCRLVSRFVTGDHDCLVGEIISAETIAGGPALPMRGRDYAPRPAEENENGGGNGA